MDYKIHNLYQRIPATATVPVDFDCDLLTETNTNIFPCS